METFIYASSELVYMGMFIPLRLFTVKMRVKSELYIIKSFAENKIIMIDRNL